MAAGNGGGGMGAGAGRGGTASKAIAVSKAAAASVSSSAPITPGTPRDAFSFSRQSSAIGSRSESAYSSYASVADYFRFADPNVRGFVAKIARS